jgi:two-component system chemotaxis response regulator CheY
MKMLIVDDSVMIRKVIQAAVEKIGFEPLEVKNGQEAMDKIEKEYNDIALVLLDWNMPVLDGYSVLKNIKQNEKYSHIPVLMVTTEVDRKRVIQAVEAGATNYLMKPFSQEDLIDKMNSCIEKKGE